jgi:alcohol dehydrogenase class IV
MRFEFATATRIIFGGGTINEVPALAAGMGSSAFIITGRTTDRAQPLIEQLNKQDVKCITFSVPGEPTTTLIKAATKQARQAKSDLVIGIGGGSVLDTGKAIAAMLTNAGELEDYLEVVGRGQPLTEPPAAYIAMRSPLMLPRLAVVDPTLSHSMPLSITASTGLDALTQLMEVYVSNKANPVTDGICREGLRRAARSLREAYEDGSNTTAREDMALASLLGGLALANSKLGAVHGFAGPLGGMLRAPHGVICAKLLPYVMETNVKALQDRAADSPAVARYNELAQILTARAEARANDGVTWIQDLCKTLQVPPLAEFGLKEQDVPAAVAKAQKSSSMKGNPIALTAEELTEILKKAI